MGSGELLEAKMAIRLGVQSVPRLKVNLISNLIFTHSNMILINTLSPIPIVPVPLAEEYLT